MRRSHRRKREKVMAVRMGICMLNKGKPLKKGGTRQREEPLEQRKGNMMVDEGGVRREEWVFLVLSDCLLFVIECPETMAMEERKAIEWIAEALLMFHQVQVLAILFHH